MFADVDGKSVEAVHAATLALLKTLPPTEVAVLCNPPEDISRSLGRYGCHIVWPGLIVSPDQALAHVSRVLEDTVGSGQDAKVDTSVYSGSGLRMIGSSKPDLPPSYAYLPTSVWRGPDQGLVSAEFRMDDLEHWLARTTIQVPHPQWPPVDAAPTKNQQLRLPVPLHPAADSAAMQVLDKLLPPVYRGTARRIIARGPRVLVIPLASRYCHNKQAEHRSNHVYIVLTKGRPVEQRCHCMCDIPRLSGPCHAYRGRIARTPHDFVFKYLRDTADT
jgi:hypothetical protein